MTEFAYTPDTVSAPTPEINLDTKSPILPDSVLQDRAHRADFALGDKSPGAAVLKDQFANGNEGVVRQQAAAEADVSFRQQKLDRVKQVINQGGQLTDTDVHGIMAVGNTPEANPDTVFEDKFGKNVVVAGVTGDPGKNLVFQSAFDVEPEKTREGVLMAQGAISRKQQAKDILEVSQEAYNAIPWINLSPEGRDQQDKLGNLAKNILSGGIAQYVNQRNLLNSDPGNSFLPGSNKLEQIQYLYLLPGKEFKPALMAAAGPGSEFWKTNPSDAIDFIRAAVEFGTSDAYAENIYAVTNVAGMLPVTTGLRAIGLIKRGVSVENNLVKTAEDVAKDVLSTSSKPPLTPGDKAGRAAADVLSGSSKPPEQGYYIPEAAVKRPWESNPRFGEFSVKDGVPTYKTDDGAEVTVGRTPEVGSIKIEPQAATMKNTYTTKEGTFDYSPEGVSVKGDTKKTIYVDKPSVDKLSSVLEEGKNRTILQDNHGRYVVSDLDNISPGKAVKGTAVTAEDTPRRGLYSVHLGEDMKDVTFGHKITRVDNQTQQNFRFGSTIVSQEDKEARVALADIVKSQADTHPQDVLSKMGQHEAAAEAGARESLTRESTQTFPLGDAEAIRRNVPSLAQPSLYYNNASSLSWRRAQELSAEAQVRSAELSNAILNPTRVERLPQTAIDEAIRIAKTQVQKYNRASDAIRDQITHWDSASNTYYIETRFTKKGGELFDSAAQANHYKNLQYRLGSSATVEQEGNKFFLSHIQHVDETQSRVRDVIVTGNETPKSFMNSVLASLTGRVGPSIKSSAATVSTFQRQQRVTATHSPSVLRGAIEHEAEALQGLGKWTTNERQELEQMLIHNRDYIPPGGTGKDRGFFYRSALDFETAFNAKFGKLPTEKQIVAYDSYTRLSDLDWTLRELDLLKDKARQGIRNYRFDYTTLENGIPSKGKTDWINGKLVKDFHPLSTANANVYILPEQKFTTKFDLKDGSELSKQINDKLKSGEYQIVQMYSPREKPLSKATGVKDDIHFVVTNKFDEKAVTLGDNVEYRPGGHVIYEDQHYLKQPQIGKGTNGRDTHFGDTTVKSFPTQNEANFWAERYNTARDLLRTQDEAGYQRYMRAGNLPETADELRSKFKDGTFNLEHPFVHTLAGRDTLQSNEALARQYPGLKDTFSSYNMSQNSESAFLADRGVQLNTIKNTGTEANPIYTNVPSKLFDPYTALQKGMGQIVRSRWMSDYKVEAAESWIQEFGVLFDQSKLPIEKLRQNPIYYLNHLDAVDKGMIKGNPELYAAAMTSRQNILRFIGSQDEVGSMIQGLELKLIQGIDSVGGKSIANFAEQRALPLIKDAPSYARSATFNLVDGMFNTVQLIQQGLAATHALMISPINGMKGLTMAALTRLYRHTEDPAIIASMIDKAVAMGWNRQSATEAFEGWHASGVQNIGGEVTMLSQAQDPSLFKTAWGSLVDKGQMFFRAGDRLGRDVSWFTAYHDWKGSNPGRIFDNRARTEMSSRFDTMNMNMTRASNAAYNEGVLSIPSQFWTWNLRFTEQMLGKQLTLAEKSRVFTGNALLWGAPATLGGVTFGSMPMMNYDDIRQYAIAHGINVHEKWYQALSEGLPTMLLNAITGHETSLQRFSPNATQLRDIVDGKKEWLEVLTGASGQMMGKLASSTMPFVMWARSGFSQDSGYKVKMNDIVNGMENVSSFNNAEKAIVAYNTGKYISKNEMLVTDVDKFESVLLGLGLNPQRVNDAYQMIDYGKNLKSAQDKIEKKIIEDWRLAISAAGRQDHQTMVDYMNRVQVYVAQGNFTKKQELDIFRKAVSGNESLVDSVNRRWLQSPDMQNIPAVKQWFENEKR